MFNIIINKTVGKYIYKLGNNNWNIQQLRELLEEIIFQRKFFENYEIEYDFKEEGERKLTLNARQLIRKENKSDLILLAIQYAETKEKGT